LLVRRSCLLAECFMFQQQFGVGGQNHCHNSSGTTVWFERGNHIAQKEKHSCMYGRRFNHEVTHIAPQPNSTTGHSTLRAESKPPISSTSVAPITKRAGYAKAKGGDLCPSCHAMIHCSFKAHKAMWPVSSNLCFFMVMNLLTRWSIACVDTCLPSWERSILWLCLTD
jgi:hypothetical protein